MSDGVFNPEVNGVVLTGDGGNDVLNGTHLNDQLFGLGGRDRLKGMAGADLLDGGIGHDWLSGGAGSDKLKGGIGNDTLLGGRGHDWLFGNEGNDALWGNSGNDDLSGGEGNDLLVGGKGNDFLDGGLGNDVIHLGRGSDIVLLAPGNGFDILTDFKDGQDKIQLEGGLTFENLDIRRHGLFSTEIHIDKPGDPNDGEKLARLIGIRPNKLTEDDFIFDGGGGSNSAPTITSAATASVAENQTNAIDVQTSDDSDSEGSGLTYSLTTNNSGGTDNSLFSIDAATGVLSFNAPPDFEAPGDANGDNAYQVQVTVTDSAGLSDSQDTTVNVTDVAENSAPTITSDGGGATATVNVAENQTAATDVQANDDSDSEGSGLTYSLTTNSGGGTDNGLFSIDASTGVLNFNASPDFEAPGDANGDNAYQVQVTVTDSSGLTDSQDITVNVTDVAENSAPTITSDGGGATATVNVAENQTAVTDVQTSDNSDSEGSGLTYSLTTNSGGGTDNGLFSIDAATGVLSFNDSPDFEAPGDANGDNAYQVQVTVTDSAGLTDSQNITVNVTDVAENSAPTITSDGGGATATVNVAENQTAVTDVQTSDDSDSEGSGLTYSLTTNSSGGTDNGLFSIDASTGVLSFNAAPDFEAPNDANGDNAYQVQVTVTDSAGLSDSQDITVNVTDVAENVDPVAQNQTYSTFGNTVLEVAGADIPGNEVTSVSSATSLLNGATDANGDPLTVVSETKATTAGGVVTINADGSFFYVPEAGDTSVADSFTFTVLDGNGGSSTATATINVGERIWYVDDDAAPGGDGTSANPFSSLAPLNTGGSSDGLDGNGDTIYMLAGTYTGGITLENNQSLLGQAVDLVVGGTTLINGSNANRPSLSSPGANAITLASGNTVRGLEITGATTQDGIIGSNVGNLLVDNNVFSAIDLEAIQVNNTTANATITIQNNVIDGTNSTGNTEIEVLNTGGSATNVTINVTGNDLNAINSAGILVQNNGAGSANVTVDNNQIERTANTASGIQVDLNGNGTITTLINNNIVTGAAQGSDAFLITSDNGTGTVNATVTNNRNTAAPTVVGAGFAAQSTDNNILNLTLSGNNFTGLNGGVVFGALTDDIVLDQNGASTFNVTQTSAANVSANNNGDTVGTNGTITFGQPAPPTP